jgi:hypothetical protein
MLLKNPNGEDLQSKALCSLIFFLETTYVHLLPTFGLGIEAQDPSFVVID